VEARTQIEQLNLELNAAARAKDEFLALLGHELRNPLAPIVTALELMKMRDASTQREQAVIQRQVNHLRRLVDDLLDVSRITRGKIALRKERVNLADILHKSVEMVHANVERKQQSLTVDVGPIPLLVDPDRLAQVVSNLLTNASRYTPQGGRLALRAWRSGAHVHIEMQDDGEGIPAALLPRIFEPFVQGTRKLQASVGGLGIGLALVKNLTELHGGSVAASSAGEGRGSVFAVTIPAAIDDQPGATPAPVPTQTARAPLARRKILVVDDNEDAANFLAELLSVLGQTVLVAYNAADALRLCSTLAPAQWPDLAVLDLGLPDLDGYQLADRLRLLPGGAHLPCVALTGYGQEADKARSRAARFTGHLVKPVERKDLLGLFATLDQ
jgi:CheY-like chemotaxis protein/two-component sensor histidine kinase